MRLVKCRECGKKKPNNEAYLYVHVTSGGNKQNRYYCDEKCYEKEQNDIHMLKQCQYFIDEVLGYVCVNNQKNKSLKELVDAGYTREQVFDTMVELKQPITEGLTFRSDIENEGQKILYIYAIIRNKIKEITDRNSKIQLKQEETYLSNNIEIVEETTLNIKHKSVKQNKKSLMDIIKGGNNE